MTTTAAEIRVTRPSRDTSARPKRIDLTDVAGLVSADDNVVIGHGSAWPKAAVEALVADATVPFRMVHNRIDDHLPYFSEAARKKVRHVGFMVARHTREHFHTGAADFVPNAYGTTPSLFHSGAVGCDVVVLHLSPPDQDGWCSFGTCVAYLPAAVERARTVIAQINPQMPRTFGTAIHMSALDYVVDVDHPLHSVPTPAWDAVTDAIAANVAGLVRDADAVQIGIGKLGDAVLAKLAHHRDLTLWTETFNDSVIALLRSGVLRSRSAEEPAITATFVTGSDELYQVIDSNPAVRMLPVDHVNHPAYMSVVPNLVAINSAIEVDLAGQVNAESIGSLTYSGSGGHLEIALGANFSPGGRYILALPATARGRTSGASAGKRTSASTSEASAGKRTSASTSRIVAQLDAGVTVTVPRALTGTVVTEYGVAELRGRNLRERAEALTSIAHPDHQRALAAAIDQGAP